MQGKVWKDRLFHLQIATEQFKNMGQNMLRIWRLRKVLCLHENIRLIESYGRICSINTAETASTVEVIQNIRLSTGIELGITKGERTTNFAIQEHKVNDIFITDKGAINYKNIRWNLMVLIHNIDCTLQHYNTYFESTLSSN